MSETRPSFWTTLPGILTGLAALVTALVAAAALFTGSQGDATRPLTTPAPATGERGGNPSATSPAEPGPVGAVPSTVELLDGDGLDLDTGRQGSDVLGQLHWSSGQLNLYGVRNAVVPTETDERGCADALERRSDGYLAADRLADGAVVCLTTQEGALVQARISPPGVRGTLTVHLTVWPR